MVAGKIMARVSAGIVLWKKTAQGVKVFLVHPGGPFWTGKDEASWDFPKGEPDNGEEELVLTAIRELKEETGIDISSKSKEEFISLGSLKRKDGKEIYLWAVEGDWTGLLICKSWVKMQKKDKSWISFPEVDRGDFFTIEKARKKVFSSLLPFIDRLEEKIKQE